MGIGSQSITPSTSPSLTTKGDVLAYDTSTTRLAVGSNGQVLSSDSAEDTGLKWVSVAGGKDIQMTTSAITTADFSTSSADMIDVTNGTLTLSGLTSDKTYTVFTWMSYQMQHTVVSTKYATTSINGVEQTKIQNHTSVARHDLETIHGCETGVTDTTTCICKLRVQSDGSGTYQVRMNNDSAFIISILAIEE